MVAAIHQPQYLPWLGLIDRIIKSDVFVFLDSVPYSKNYFYNRNRIKTANGWIWLTIPVLFKGKFGEKIENIRIDNGINWREKHLKSISLAYKKAPFFKQYIPHLEDFYSKEWLFLSQASIASTELMLKLFGITARTIKSSDIKAEGAKETLLIDICRKLGAKAYLAGPDGKNYIRPENWKESNIEVRFQDFRHPKYQQLFGEFLPQMSAVDMLFNYGQDCLSLLLDAKREYSDLVLK